MIIYQDMERKNNIEDIDENKKTIYIATRAEAEELFNILNMDVSGLFFSKYEHTHLENHQGFDFIATKIMDVNDDFNECYVEIFYAKKQLVFIYEDGKNLELFIEELMKHEHTDISLDMTLFLFFNVLFRRDTEYLKTLEDRIEDLEDDIEKENNLNVDFIKVISDIRKTILKLKRYYDVTTDILEDIQGNINGMIEVEHLRLFDLQRNHVERLHSSLTDLHEYVIQVKEGYQTQLDISQNRIMQYLTVITALFLPLSVIAAWYGMNFKMPEFESSFAYPLIILLSAAIVIITIIILKKKKWF